MVLRTITVDDPVPGLDWKHAVPGKYLYDVTGITAVLNAASSLQAIDVSGNGNDASYVSGPTQSTPTPFGFPGAVQPDAATGYPLGATVPFVMNTNLPIFANMDWSGDWTIEWWSKIEPNGPDDWLSVTFPAMNTILVRGFGVTPTVWSLDLTGIVYHSPAPTPIDTEWHHYAWSYVAATPAATRFYVDGGALVPVVVGVVNPVIPAANTGGKFVLPFATALPNGTDELAIFPAALGPAQVAAHYAARGDFDAYTAAVLADTPSAYYHLDEAGGVGGRQPALEVTDGANIVELIPAGFPTPTSGNAFTYSWQPRLQARAESADLTLITVPCPELHLPAGYTVGTLTPDLGPADQWSNILIWWDDALQTATQQADAYQYAPGAHLIYQQVKGGT